MGGDEAVGVGAGGDPGGDGVGGGVHSCVADWGATAGDGGRTAAAEAARVSEDSGGPVGRGLCRREICGYDAVLEGASDPRGPAQNRIQKSVFQYRKAEREYQARRGFDVAHRAGAQMKSVAVALVVLGISATASAKVVVYSARSGDTPESIAADYYGNRSQAIFILETNGLERDKPLKPGQKVRIPTAFHYRVRKGDTLEGLAKRFLDDGRRAPFLAAFSGLRPTDKLREGQDLLIPFQHVHRTEVPESLQSVARAFYGDASKAKLLADYNFRSAPMLAKGERVLVPIGHVHIRAVKLQPVVERPVGKMKEAPAPVVMVAPPKEAQKREAELAEKVGKSLAIAE